MCYTFWDGQTFSAGGGDDVDDEEEEENVREGSKIPVGARTVRCP